MDVWRFVRFGLRVQRLSGRGPRGLAGGSGGCLEVRQEEEVEGPEAQWEARVDVQRFLRSFRSRVQRLSGGSSGGPRGLAGGSGGRLVVRQEVRVEGPGSAEGQGEVPEAHDVRPRGSRC